jgi:transposase
VNVPRCLIGIEAGMATHYMARELVALGHEVKQVPAAYAKPFRQGRPGTSVASAISITGTMATSVGG